MDKIIITFLSLLCILALILCYDFSHQLEILKQQRNLWKNEKHRMLKKIYDLRTDLNNLNDFYKKDPVTTVPDIWPTEGKITSLFGTRVHPISKRKKFHTGVDIANLNSTDILCTASGKVEFSGYKGGYGNTVIIDHNNGFKTLYAHAYSLLVKKGDFVSQGTLIAKMGSTGYSTGPHLHYEIFFAGEVLDPTLFVN